MLPKLLFIFMHLCTLAIGVYKVNSMGLLPTHDSDWAIYLPVTSVSFIFILYFYNINVFSIIIFLFA